MVGVTLRLMAGGLQVSLLEYHGFVFDIFFVPNLKLSLVLVEPLLVLDGRSHWERHRLHSLLRLRWRLDDLWGTLLLLTFGRYQDLLWALSALRHWAVGVRDVHALLVGPGG